MSIDRFDYSNIRRRPDGQVDAAILPPEPAEEPPPPCFLDVPSTPEIRVIPARIPFRLIEPRTHRIARGEWPEETEQGPVS